jgi:hypothetical protein
MGERDAARNQCIHMRRDHMIVAPGANRIGALLVGNNKNDFGSVHICSPCSLYFSSPADFIKE